MLVEGAGQAWALLAVEIIASIGLVVTALIKLVPRARELWLRTHNIFSRVDEQAQAKMEFEASLRGIRRVNALNAILTRWVQQYGAQRALLLTANNGGEAWKGNGPLYVSNPAQQAGNGEPNTWKLWQQWKSDPWYQQFLGSCLEAFAKRAPIKLNCAVDVEGELREAYDGQGTVCSLVLPFKWVNGSVLWYVSLNFGRKTTDLKGDPRPITSKERSNHLTHLDEIVSNRAECRAMIDELRMAYDSVR